MDTVQTYAHHSYSNYSISLALFRDLKNAKELRQCVMGGELEVTLLNTQMITDPFQVIVAANRAVHLHKTGKMTTKNVHSEVLFCLSPTKNISESFRKFGMSDNDSSVFVVLINDSDNKVMNLLASKVQGTQSLIEDVKNFTDESLVRKMYKVTDEELKGSSLVEILVSKIASKEFVTV